MALRMRAFDLIAMPTFPLHPSLCNRCIRDMKLRRAVPRIARSLSTSNTHFESARRQTPSLRSTTKSPTSKRPIQPAREFKSSDDMIRQICARYPAANAALLNQALKQPTVIYEAPSATTFYIASTALGTFFFGYGSLGAIHYALFPAHELWWFLPPALAFAGIALCGIGLRIYSIMFKLVKRITIVPQTGKPLLAQVDTRTFGPIWRKTVSAPMESLRLGRTLGETAPPAEDTAADEARRQEVPIIARPLIWLADLSKKYFRETRNAFMRDMMVPMRVPGRGTYKLDARGSAMGGSMGFDRLIDVDHGMANSGLVKKK